MESITPSLFFFFFCIGIRHIILICLVIINSQQKDSRDVVNGVRSNEVRLYRLSREHSVQVIILNYNNILFH